MNRCVRSCLNTISYVGSAVLLFSFIPIMEATQLEQRSTDQQALSADQPLNAATEATNKFALDFYKVLSKTTKGNVFASPLSLQVVLALVATGARGSTYDQIKKVLGFPDDPKDMLAGYGSLVEVLGKSSDVLNVATRMFIDEAFKVKEEFQANAIKHFKSDAHQVDYKKDAKGARKTINGWVEEKTNKKIQDLIGEGVLSSLTVMVLVNAIHFKAKWQTPFPSRLTIKEDFYVDEKNTIKVDMMHLSESLYYSHDSELKAKILELPYKGNEFSMFIILPDERTGLARVEEALGSGDVSLTDRLKSLHHVKVDVSLPKFTMTQTMELVDVLKELGVTEIFEDGVANFTGLTDEEVVVSKVIQKAFVAVDEEGTEAAAATGIMFVNYCWEEPKVVEFVADHPFIIIITKKLFDKNCMLDMFLFIGRFYGTSE